VLCAAVVVAQAAIMETGESTSRSSERETESDEKKQKIFHCGCCDWYGCDIYTIAREK
jgi:hypothetical protein